MNFSIEANPALLAERLDALPGIERLRGATAGARAYLIGGAVRDLLLGLERADLDVAVEGDVGPVARALGGELREHGRFATASVWDGELQVDLASTRAETYAAPGALPDVRPAPIAEDLARRDFTVNAMAVPLEGEPKLIDPHGGLDDLRSGLLRVLHPGSFADDPTRALRAARYSARLGFRLEQETEALLRAADLSTVSSDRVEAELRRIVAEEDPGKGFALVREFGLLPRVDPAGPERAARVSELAARPPWADWVDRPAAVMRALAKLSAQQRALLESDPPERPSQGVRLARPLDPEELLVARAAGAEWLDRYAADWRRVTLEIDGDELIAAGIPEGPAVGRGLAAAHEAKLDGELSGRDAELARALEVAEEATGQSD